MRGIPGLMGCREQLSWRRWSGRDRVGAGDEGRRGRGPWGLEVVAEHFPFDLFEVDDVPGLAFGGRDVH